MYIFEINDLPNNIKSSLTIEGRGRLYGTPVDGNLYKVDGAIEHSGYIMVPVDVEYFTRDKGLQTITAYLYYSLYIPSTNEILEKL
jgi:hypothetical protein